MYNIYNTKNIYQVWRIIPWPADKFCVNTKEALKGSKDWHFTNHLPLFKASLKNDISTNFVIFLPLLVDTDYLLCCCYFFTNYFSPPHLHPHLHTVLF